MHNSVCPNCGNFARLAEDTGWCADCTDAIRERDRRDEWLRRNADALETWLSQGLTLRQAVVVVLERNRPTCLKCGKPIKHGTNGRHVLCTRTIECRKARRRYKYLVYEKGYGKEKALRIVLELEAA